MKSSELIMLLSVLFSPVLIDAQTRSLEEQQAISHISQAEYYARMALRSLEASEKIGKAPYFNYQNAREDIEKVLTEFKTYLKGDESTDLPPAVPLVVDGRYFAESIKDFLATGRRTTGKLQVIFKARVMRHVRSHRKRQARTLKRDERKMSRIKSKGAYGKTPR